MLAASVPSSRKTDVMEFRVRVNGCGKGYNRAETSDLLPCVSYICRSSILHPHTDTYISTYVWSTPYSLYDRQGVSREREGNVAPSNPASALRKHRRVTLKPATTFLACIPMGNVCYDPFFVSSSLRLRKCSTHTHKLLVLCMEYTE